MCAAAMLASCSSGGGSGDTATSGSDTPSQASQAESSSGQTSAGQPQSSGGSASAVEPSDAPSSPSSSGDAETPDPNLLKGKTIWYAGVTAANPLTQAIAQAINDRLTAYGATMVRSFAINNTTGQPDLSVQAAGVTRAITAKVDAIAYFLMDPKSLKPQVEKARAAGIPVFAVFGEPDGFDVDAYMTLSDEQQGYISAKYLADQLPKGAKVALITGPPTANVNAEMAGANKALKEAGVTIVGDENQQRNLTDNTAGGQTIMQGILQSHPDVQGVFAYNDDTALGAIAATKAAGKQVVFTSRNASSDGVAAVKAGTLAATCDIDPIGVGHAVAQALVDQLSGKHEYSDNAQLPSPDASDCLITKDNVDQWKPYDKIIKYQDIKSG